MKKYFLLHKRKLAAYLVIDVLASMIISTSGFVTSALTRAAMGRNFHQFLLIAGIAVVYYIVDAYFDYLPRYAKSKLLNAVMHSMRADLVTHYTKSDLLGLLKENPTERTNRVVNDLPVIQSEYLSPILLLISVSFTFVFSLIGAFYAQGVMTLIMLALSFIPMLGPLINAKILSNSRKNAQVKQKQFQKDFENFSRNISTVIITNSIKIFQKMLGKASHEMRDTTVFSDRQKARTYGISYGLGSMVWNGTWIVGGIFVFMHQLSIPGLVAMVALMNTVSGPIQEFSDYSTTIIGSRGVVKDYLTFMANKTQENASDKQDFTEKLEQLQVQQMTYAYDDHLIFEKASYDFASNHRYAIKGESGAGKSTFLSIIMGILKPQVGQVLLNQTNLQDISAASYFKKLAYVPQKTAIFTGTLADNVAMFQDYQPEKIITCLEKAGLRHLLEQINYNIDIKLGDELTLSGGEERRLDIARSLYHAAEIMILDEPTSGLDTTNEQAIANVLATIDDVIIIVVTHSTNPDFLDIFDKVLELKDNLLIES